MYNNNIFEKEFQIVGIRKEQNIYTNSKGEEVKQYVLDIASDYQDKYVGLHVSSAYISVDKMPTENLEEMIDKWYRAKCSYYKKLNRLFIENIVEELSAEGE